MAAYQRETGGQVMAFAHNGNLSQWEQQCETVASQTGIGYPTRATTAKKEILDV